MPVRPPAPRSARAITVTAGLALCLAGSARAEPAPPDPASTQPCRQAPLPLTSGRPAFGPDELLSYEVTVLGIRTGKVHLAVGERTRTDGVATYPLRAQARSDAFLDLLGAIDARMVSFFNPETLLPAGMVNRMTVHRMFQDGATESHEQATFTPPAPSGGSGAVRSRFRRAGPDGRSERTVELQSGAHVVDLLSLLYTLRTRELRAGAAVCFDLYHRRKLWRVDGTVGDVELVRAPAGARRGRRIDTLIHRTTPGDPPRPLTVWLSEDADRVPLAVSTPEGPGQLELKLVSRRAGRHPLERSGDLDATPR